MTKHWPLEKKPAASRLRPHKSGYFLIRPFFRYLKISPSTSSVFNSNLPVHTCPMLSGFTLEKLSLHIVTPYWFIIRQETGHEFASSSVSKISGCAVHKLSDSLRIFFSHPREPKQKYTDSLLNSPDACEQKPYPERKSYGFKKFPDMCRRGLTP